MSDPRDDKKQGAAVSPRELLSQIADRMERDGRTVTARLFRNAAFLEEASPDWEEYEWIRRADGRTDDVEVKR